MIGVIHLPLLCGLLLSAFSFKGISPCDNKGFGNDGDSGNEGQGQGTAQSSADSRSSAYSYNYPTYDYSEYDYYYKGYNDNNGDGDCKTNDCSNDGNNSADKTDDSNNQMDLSDLFNLLGGFSDDTFLTDALQYNDSWNQDSSPVAVYQSISGLTVNDFLNSLGPYYYWIDKDIFSRCILFSLLASYQDTDYKYFLLLSIKLFLTSVHCPYVDELVEILDKHWDEHFGQR